MASDLILTVGGDLNPLTRQLRGLLRENRINFSLNDRGTNLALGRIRAGADAANKAIEAANQRVIAFGASALILGGLVSSLKQLVSVTVSVEKSFSEINAVFNLTSKNLSKFSREIFDVARETGQSFDVAAKAALEFSRQGLSVEQTSLRVRDALTLTRQSGLDVTKSVESLTAAINGFARESLNSTQIINKLIAVDSRFAVSAKDLAEALSRVGSTAQDAGLNFDQLLGLVTSAQQITARGGAVIGNAFKTIFTRIQRTDTLDQLEDLGISVRDLQGEALSADRILQNLAATFDSLTQAEKQQVAELSAGVFQINQFKSILSDLGRSFNIFTQATDASTVATNEAIRRNEVLNKSLSALLQNVKTTATEVGSVIGTLTFAEPLKNALKLINNNFIVDALKGAGNPNVESIGENLGKSILTGLGNALVGPGFVFAVALFAKVAIKSFNVLRQDISGLFSVRERDLTALQGIERVLASASSLEQKRFIAAKSIVEQERIVLQLLQSQNAARAAQAGATSALIRQLPPDARKQFVKLGRAAGGYLPGVINEEQSAVRRGVGGAKASAKPVVIPNFNFGKGQKGTIVANTDEYIIPNYNNSGGSAIFNPKMIRQLGLPQGAKKINGADGFIPNFASGDKPAALPYSGLLSFVNNSAKTNQFFSLEFQDSQGEVKKTQALFFGGNAKFQRKRGAQGEFFGENVPFDKKRIPYIDLQVYNAALKEGLDKENAIQKAYRSARFDRIRSINGIPVVADQQFQQTPVNDNIVKTLVKQFGLVPDFKKPNVAGGFIPNFNQPNLDFLRFLVQIGPEYAQDFDDLYKKDPQLGKFLQDTVDQREPKAQRELGGMLGGKYLQFTPNKYGLGSTSYADLKSGPKGIRAQIAELFGRFQQKSPLANQGYIPNFAPQVFSRKRGFNPEFSKDRILETDAGSFAAYQFNKQAGNIDLDFISSRRKGDAFAIFGSLLQRSRRGGFPIFTEELLMQEPPFAPSMRRNREGAKLNNYEFLLKKYPQLRFFNQQNANTSGTFQYGKLGKEVPYQFSSLADLEKYVNALSRKNFKLKGNELKGLSTFNGGYIPNFASFTGQRGSFIGSGITANVFKNPKKDIVFKDFGKLENQIGDLASDFIRNEFAISKLATNLNLPVAKVFGTANRSVARGGLSKEFVSGTKGADLNPGTFRTVATYLTDLFSKSGISADDLNDGNIIIKGGIRGKSLQQIAKDAVVIDPGAFSLNNKSGPLSNKFNQFRSSASGYIPNFNNPLAKAIGREKQASGLPLSSIYVDQNKRLQSSMNPLGLMVANRRDEPLSGTQGIRRVLKEGGDPKTAGMARGFVPNFAEFDSLRRGVSGQPFSVKGVTETGIDPNQAKQFRSLFRGLRQEGVKSIDEFKRLSGEIANLAVGINLTEKDIEIIRGKIQQTASVLVKNLISSAQQRKSDEALEKQTIAENRRREGDFLKAKAELNKKSPKIPTSDAIFEEQKRKEAEQKQKQIEQAFLTQQAANNISFAQTNKAIFGGGPLLARLPGGRANNAGILSTSQQVQQQRVLDTPTFRELELKKQVTGLSNRQLQELVGNISGGGLSFRGVASPDRRDNILESRRILAQNSTIRRGNNTFVNRDVSNAVLGLSKSGTLLTDFNKNVQDLVLKGESLSNAYVKAGNILLKSGGNSAQLTRAQLNYAGSLNEFSDDVKRTRKQIRVIAKTNEAFTAIQGGKDFSQLDRGQQNIVRSRLREQAISDLNFSNVNPTLLAQDKSAQKLINDSVNQQIARLNPDNFANISKNFTSSIGVFGNVDKKLNQFLKSNQNLSDDERNRLRGTAENVKAQRQQRLSGLAIAGSFAAPLLAGFIPQGEGGTTRGKALGATSGALQGVGIGASLGSLFGARGAGIGAIVGGITLGIQGAFSKATVSLEEMSAKIQEVNAKNSEQVNAVNAYIQVQQQLNDALASGASDTQIKLLQDQQIGILSRITDSGNRNQLLGAGSDVGDLVKILGKISQTGDVKSRSGDAISALFGAVETKFRPKDIQNAAKALAVSIDRTSEDTKDGLVKFEASFKENGAIAALEEFGGIFGFSTQDIADNVQKFKSKPKELGLIFRQFLEENQKYVDGLKGSTERFSKQSNAANFSRLLQQGAVSLGFEANVNESIGGSRNRIISNRQSAITGLKDLLPVDRIREELTDSIGGVLRESDTATQSILQRGKGSIFTLFSGSTEENRRTLPRDFADRILKLDTPEAFTSLANDIGQGNKELKDGLLGVIQQLALIKINTENSVAELKANGQLQEIQARLQTRGQALSAGGFSEERSSQFQDLQIAARTRQFGRGGETNRINALISQLGILDQAGFAEIPGTREIRESLQTESFKATSADTLSTILGREIKVGFESINEAVDEVIGVSVNKDDAQSQVNLISAQRIRQTLSSVRDFSPEKAIQELSQGNNIEALVGAKRLSLGEGATLTSLNKLETPLNSIQGLLNSSGPIATILAQIATQNVINKLSQEEGDLRTRKTETVRDLNEIITQGQNEAVQSSIVIGPKQSDIFNFVERSKSADPDFASKRFGVPLQSNEERTEAGKSLRSFLGNQLQQQSVPELLNKLRNNALEIPTDANTTNKELFDTLIKFAELSGKNQVINNDKIAALTSLVDFLNQQIDDKQTEIKNIQEGRVSVVSTSASQPSSSQSTATSRSAAPSVAITSLGTTPNQVSLGAVQSKSQGRIEKLESERGLLSGELNQSANEPLITRIKLLEQIEAINSEIRSLNTEISTSEAQQADVLGQLQIKQLQARERANEPLIARLSLLREINQLEIQSAILAEDSAKSFVGGFQSRILEFKASINDLSDLGAQVADSLSSNLGNSFGDFVTGAKRGSDAFREFAFNIFNDASRAFASKAVQSLVGGIFGGFTGANQGGLIGRNQGGPIKLAKGGSVPAMLTGGEYYFDPRQSQMLGKDFLMQLNAGTARKFAGGGLVRGGSGVKDDIPARLQPGGFVVKRSSVQKYGSDYMDALSSGRVQKRFIGGAILGALLGGGVGYATGGKKGALIGALGGGLLGGFSQSAGLLKGIGLNSGKAAAGALGGSGVGGLPSASSLGGAFSNNTLNTGITSKLPLNNFGSFGGTAVSSVAKGAAGGGLRSSLIGLGLSSVLGLAARGLSPSSDISEGKPMTDAEITANRLFLESEQNKQLDDAKKRGEFAYLQVNPQGGYSLNSFGLAPATRRFGGGGMVSPELKEPIYRANGGYITPKTFDVPNFSYNNKPLNVSNFNEGGSVSSIVTATPAPVYRAEGGYVGPAMSPSSSSSAPSSNIDIKIEINNNGSVSASSSTDSNQQNGVGSPQFGEGLSKVIKGYIDEQLVEQSRNGGFFKQNARMQGR
jgi:TP901 family phage tail tape measure protein